MRKVIGIVGEGPIDQMVLKAAINRITGESHIYRNIQPEQDMLGEFGNGWKGVYRWCETNAEARKEKEVHCRCESTICPKKNEESPLVCRQLKEGNCPVIIPCRDHVNSPEGYRIHLEQLLRSLIGDPASKEKIVIVIPCDSTDAWTVAAYEEDIDDIEAVVDPWERIISLKKEYHGIRIPGHKKNTAIYRLFLPQIIKSARKLETDIRQWAMKS